MVIVACACVFVPLSCGVSVNYSMTGAATEAETISITEFYNNADLGPANMSQVFTNELKNYFVQNSSLSVVVEEGELQLEGEITDLRITPISPTATDDPTVVRSLSEQILREADRLARHSTVAGEVREGEVPWRHGRPPHGRVHLRIQPLGAG